VVGGAQLFV